VHVNTLEAHYRLAQGTTPQACTLLDRLLDSVLDHDLEQALDRLGVPVEEEICIRELDAPVHLSWQRNDEDMARAWSLALAESIHAALQDGRAEGVAHYRSRLQALIDFAAGVATGDLRRAWAWRQLGLATLGPGASMAQAAAQLQQTLIAEPPSIVAVLIALAERGLLPGLIERVDPVCWERCAARMLEVLGAPAGLVQPSPRAGSLRRPEGAEWPNSDEEVESDRAEAVRAVAWYLVHRSVVARAIITGPQPHTIPGSVARSWAILIAAEADPGILRREPGDVLSVLAFIAGVLSEPSRQEAHLGPATAPPGLPDERPGSATASASTEPAGVPKRVPSRLAAPPLGAGSGAERTESPGLFREHGEQDDHGSLVKHGEVTPARGPEGCCASGSETLAACHAGSVDAPESPPGLSQVRCESVTDMGGLLFLLHVVDELSLPDEWARDALFRYRTLRWTLFHLAKALAPVPDDDPAVLAFCGLGPDQEAPTRRAAPAGDLELDQMVRAARRVTEALRHRLSGTERSDRELLDWVCRRRARVLADPGWIELYFRLDAVATEIRRAGLDLDPGFVPWLGVVLKFHYE